MISAQGNIPFAQEDSNSSEEKDFDLSFTGKIGNFKPARSSYLGTQIGAGPNVFDFVKAGGDLDLRTTGLELGYQLHHDEFLDYFKGLKITGGIESGRAHQNQMFNALDPMGNNLLIPGVGVGPDGAGFFLPGPTNQITGARYNTEFDYHTFSLNFISEWKTSAPALTVKPSIGLRYEKAVTTSSFSGDIPLFFRQFAYNTKTDIESISPLIGLDLSYTLNPIFDIFGGVHYAYNFNKGRGRDSLDFTGIAKQTARIRNNKSTDSYGVTVGTTIDLNMPFLLTVQGDYRQLGNVPVIDTRQGVGVSDFSYEDADIYSASLRASIKF